MYSTYSCLGSSAAPIVRGREWESSVRYGKGMTLLSGAILTCYTHLLRLYVTLSYGRSHELQHLRFHLLDSLLFLEGDQHLETASHTLTL